jgi:hypothetical protein
MRANLKGCNTVGVRLKFDADRAPPNFFYGGTHENHQMLLGEQLMILEPYQYELHSSVWCLIVLLGIRTEASSYEDANDENLPHRYLRNCDESDLRIMLRLCDRHLCGSYPRMRVSTVMSSCWPKF